jgi:hypothetical protein
MDPLIDRGEYAALAYCTYLTVQLNMPDGSRGIRTPTGELRMPVHPSSRRRPAYEVVPALAGSPDEARPACWPGRSRRCGPWLRVHARAGDAIVRRAALMVMAAR